MLDQRFSIPLGDSALDHVEPVAKITAFINMPVTECLCRFCWVGFCKDRIGVRKHDHKVLQLAFGPADHAKGLAKIHLCVPPSMAQRHEDLFRAPLLLTNIVGDDCDPIREPMLVSQPVMDGLGRVALLLALALIVLENLIDDRNERVQLWANWGLAAPIPRRHCVFQSLQNRLVINLKQPRSLSLTHALNVARTAYPIIKFHRMHFPDHCLLFQA